ncbi:MAG: hypothetical protein ACKN9V_01970 [Pseudomonadota bacterium]
MRFGFTFILVFLSQTIFAFPQNVRAGYANCVTCHQSPTGGGILTSYGRKLSADWMSAWGRENEDEFLYGSVSLPQWLNMGGDIRALQLYQNRASRESAEFIFMQADVEAAASIGKVTVDATAGVTPQGNPLSRRHFLQYQPTEELSFRVGRFLPAVGINTENHSVAVKRGVGRDQGTETYNVEAAWIDQNFDVFITGILGRPDSLNLGAEMGGALSSSIFLGNRHKIGASYVVLTRNVGYRNLAGPFFILGLGKKFFLMVDTAFTWFKPQLGAVQSGFADTVRFNFEMSQGVHFYLSQEFFQNNFQDTASRMEAYGVGFQFFPRPHLELNTQFLKQRYGGTSSSFADYAYAMLHFYL